jgi:hypothetical protein
VKISVAVPAGIDDPTTHDSEEAVPMNKSILALAAIGIAFTLAACDVKKTAEGNVTLPKYEKTQSGDVTLPKYDVTAPKVEVTEEKKVVTVPTVKTEEKVIEVPKVTVTPAKDR